MLPRYEQKESLGHVNKYDDVAAKYALDGLSRKQKAVARALSDFDRGINSNPFSEPYTKAAYDDVMENLKNVR